MKGEFRVVIKIGFEYGPARGSIDEGLFDRALRTSFGIAPGQRPQ